MQACMSIKNNSNIPISVLIDDEYFFPEILPGETTFCKKVSCGSFRLTVLNNRSRVIYDLWLSAYGGSRHTLTINCTSCIFK